MEIQSAFNSGVQGFANAQKDATEAAIAIASEAAAVRQASEIENREPETSNNSDLNGSNLNSNDLSQDVVNLKVAEQQAKVSAEVIRSADDNLGTLLDIRV